MSRDSCRGGQVGKPVMKQQGFHIAERSSHSTRPDDAMQGSSQTSSKLAEGLQGLMDMCNSGNLMTAPPPAMVGSHCCCSGTGAQGYMTHSLSSCPNPDTSVWSVPSVVAHTWGADLAHQAYAKYPISTHQIKSCCCSNLELKFVYTVHGQSHQ